MITISKFLQCATSLAIVAAVAAVPNAAHADDTPECNNGVFEDAFRATECGVDALASGQYSVAVGQQTVALADSSTALGGSAFAGGVVVNSSGIIVEDNGVRNARTTAVGAFSAAGATAVGQTDASAFGYRAVAGSFGATALGANSVVSGANSVALGQGSIAERDNSVSVGGGLDGAGAVITRQITNVAAGTEGSDAVNLDQMRAGDARVEGIANTAQIAADTARTAANAAQATANTANSRTTALATSTAAALGGGSTFSTATGITAPSYAIGGQSYNNVGSALLALDNGLNVLDARVDDLSVSTDLGFRQANGGIATALALGGTMIVPDSTVSVNFNLATYRGEQGFSGAVVFRAAPRVYISGGFAGSTVKGSTGGRVGMAFGF